MSVLYVLLTLVFVKGFSNTLNIPELKDELSTIQNVSSTSTSLTLAGVVATSSGAESGSAAGVYQSILLIIFLLAYVWLFRRTNDETTPVKLAVKEPFYKGMQQLVPFLLTILVIGLQLIPLIVGLGIFGIVQSNGLAATTVEVFLWGLMAGSLSVLTLYFLSSSIIALVIVTLPGTTPMQALKNAKKKTEFRRSAVMVRLFALTLLVSIVLGLLLMLTILVIPAAAEFIFLVLSAVSLPIVVGAVYKLYRAIL